VSSELSPENAEFLKQSVADGRYAHASQALNEAMTLLRMRDELRAEVQIGIEEADRGELLPAEDVFTRLNERAARIEQSAGRDK